jgi:hypothetical protein
MMARTIRTAPMIGAGFILDVPFCFLRAIGPNVIVEMLIDGPRLKPERKYSSPRGEQGTQRFLPHP